MSAPGKDPTAGKKTFLLRVSLEMFKEIEKLAAAEFRSVNGQIEYLLHDALQRRGRAGKSSAA